MKVQKGNIKIGNLYLRPSNQEIDLIQKIINIFTANNQNFHNLIEVAQYDYTDKKQKPPKEAQRALRTLSKILKIRQDKLKKITASSKIFSTVVYLLLEKNNYLNEAHYSVNFAFEPNIDAPNLINTISFDYAIILNPIHSSIKALLVEVKRLSSLNNIDVYFNDFFKENIFR